MRTAFLILAFAFATLPAAEIRGRVVAIADGDTLNVLDGAQAQHKIRLAGIDSPEKRQAFGERSKQHLSGLVFARDVTVETTKTDRYGRQIGKIIVQGQDANLEQIRAGLAWFYRQYRREQSPDDQRIYEAAEAEARAERRGLWADPDPIAPWEFRRAKKGAKQKAP